MDNNIKKEKLKIGIVALSVKSVPPSSDTVCAPNTIVNELAINLARRGHDVYLFAGHDSKIDITLISAGQKSAWGEYKTDENDPINFTQKKIEYDLILSHEAIKSFRENKLDLIHSHDIRTSPFIFMQTNTPVLYTPHYEIGYDPSPYDLYKFREISKYPNFGATGISKKNCDFLKGQGIPLCGYTPNGIDTDVFKFENIKRNGLLFVGRIVPGKGVEKAIEIAIKLKQNITIIGPKASGKKNEKYFNSIREQYFSLKNVNYVGYVKYSVIKEYYKSSKVLLFSSLTEGMPLSVLEAMSTGMPVVASPVGGIVDIIDDGIDGCFVQNNSVEAWCEKTKIALSIESQKCREKIEKYFTIEKMVDNYEKAYYKFINKQKI